MKKDFIQAYNSAFVELPSNALWTHDGVIRTSTMQSYIYPKIAAFLNLYLVCELPTDAAFFDRAEIDRAATTGRAYPDSTKAILCLEHENHFPSSTHEMEQLAASGARLNVLITYKDGREDEQLQKLNEYYARILQNIEHRHAEFAVVLPGSQQDRPQTVAAERYWGGADLWRFFCWDESAAAFKRFY